MIDRTRLAVALAHANVGAFLHVIREGESSQDPIAYRMRWGGLGKPVAYFDDLSKHPRIFEPTTEERVSSAAGAYQITATTYDEFAPPLGITDFSPVSQDTIAVAIIDAEDALDDVMAGRIELAMRKLTGRWTSLPGAAENKRLTVARALAVYAQYGGVLGPVVVPERGTQPAAPIEDRDTAYQPEKPMAPALMFLPAILEMIPTLFGIFGKGEKGERNQKAAQVVVDAFTKAVPGAANAQDAVERAQADPAVKAAAAAAVLADPVVVQLIEVSIGPTGVKEAREANAVLMASADRWWKPVVNPVLIVTVLTLPLIYMIVYALMPLLPKVSADVVAQSIGTVIGLVLGGIMGFWMGQTYQSSQRRTTDMPPEHVN